MSASLTIIVGYLGRDPEMRYAPSGAAVTSFTVATDRSYTKDGQKVKETTWYRVQTWGKLAEACNDYLKKGSLVYATGTLIPDPETGGPKVWADKSGAARASFELNASTVQFLSTPTGTKRSGGVFTEE